MDNDTLVAVDLAKSVFEVLVSLRPGKVHKAQRLPRDQVTAYDARVFR